MNFNVQRRELWLCVWIKKGFGECDISIHVVKEVRRSYINDNIVGKESILYYI